MAATWHHGLHSGQACGKAVATLNQKELALSEVTIAEHIRDAGHATFFAGKWHRGTEDYSPNAQDFGPDLQGSGQFYYPPTDLPPTDPDADPKTTNRIADEAVKFIEQHRDKPFFAYLPFLAVHAPIPLLHIWHAHQLQQIAKADLKTAVLFPARMQQPRFLGTKRLYQFHGFIADFSTVSPAR